MDAIKTYLDNVFAAFPQTERVQALKQEMLDSMEDKYLSLKQEGKSEHEAVGSVISNFGSIDEIAADMGISQSSDEPDDRIPVSIDEAQAYLAQSKKSSVWIGIGVWLILTGASVLVFINGIRGMSSWAGYADSGSLFIMMPVVVAAVVIFIINGMAMHRYEAYNRNSLLLNRKTRLELEKQSARFMQRFTVQIAVGVAIVLLAAGTMFVLHRDSVLSVGNPAYAIPVFVIGLAVFLFVNAGMMKSAYNVLLGTGDYRYRVVNKKVERIVGTVSSVYWPSVVAIYLLWSFLSKNWNISWVIWPAASVLFGAFAGGVSNWLTTKEK